jgi:hypothetical protein
LRIVTFGISGGRSLTRPIPLSTIVARTHMYTLAANVWDLSLVQGPFSVAPCQTLIVRFATCTSLQCGAVSCSDIHSVPSPVAAPSCRLGHQSRGTWAEERAAGSEAHPLDAGGVQRLLVRDRPEDLVVLLAPVTARGRATGLGRGGHGGGGRPAFASSHASACHIAPSTSPSSRDSPRRVEENILNISRVLVTLYSRDLASVSSAGVLQVTRRV